MRLNKTIYSSAGGQTYRLIELVIGDQNEAVEPVVGIASRTIGSLHHVILVPQSEDAFNHEFNRQTGLTAESVANFLWWYSDRQEGLRSLITHEFARPDVSLHWNVSVIPWRDGQAISIVFGQSRTMEMVYEMGLRDHQPQTR